MTGGSRCWGGGGSARQQGVASVAAEGPPAGRTPLATPPLVEYGKGAVGVDRSVDEITAGAKDVSAAEEGTSEGGVKGACPLLFLYHSGGAVMAAGRVREDAASVNDMTAAAEGLFAVMPSALPDPAFLQRRAGAVKAAGGVGDDAAAPCGRSAR